MNRTVKLYGDACEKWYSFNVKGKPIITQVEYEFKEYAVSGELVRSGTEDFSAERYSKTLRMAWVWTWDGQKRNRGGYRSFEDHGLIKFNKEQYKELKEYLANKYPKAKIIQLRYF